MSLAGHIATGYRNYARFAGRSPRPEYWVFAGFLFVAQVACFLVAPMVALAFLLVSALPGAAAAVRRLHDSGRSGWWIAAPALVTPAWLLVWIGSAASALAVRSDPLDDPRYFLAASAVMAAVAMILLWLLTAPSQPGPNRYGPNPYEATQ